MLSKTQVKYIQSLFHKKFREEYGHFLVEGPKMAEEAIALSPADIINIYACNNWILSNPDLGNDLAQKVVEVNEVEMGKISGLHSPSPVLVALRKPALDHPSFFKGITLVLDGIQDPGNLGTIIRTGDWFGVRNIICGAGTADCYNPKVIQSTMGSIFRVSLFYEDLDAFFDRYQNIPIVATSLDGTPLAAGEKWENLFLVMGNESQGVKQDIVRRAGRKIMIPRIGEAESLNVAVATGIVLYELNN